MSDDGTKRWLDSYASRLADQHRDVIHFDLDLIFRQHGVQDTEARIEFLQDITGSLRTHIPYTQVRNSTAIIFSRTVLLFFWKMDRTRLGDNPRCASFEISCRSLS